MGNASKYGSQFGRRRFVPGTAGAIAVVIGSARLLKLDPLVVT
jgi:hypothetical protein